MVHDTEAQKPDIKLIAEQPAYLEVRIDPAAHGQGGAGPWTRGIAVTTVGGQRLEFVVTANVTP